MEIKVLGTGCPKCKMLEKNARDAVADLGIEADIAKVADINDIMEYNVMMTPALVINGKVKAAGRLPNVKEIKMMIQDEQEA